MLLRAPSGAGSQSRRRRRPHLQQCPGMAQFWSGDSAVRGALRACPCAASCSQATVAARKRRAGGCGGWDRLELPGIPGGAASSGLHMPRALVASHNRSNTSCIACRAWRTCPASQRAGTREPIGAALRPVSCQLCYMLAVIPDNDYCMRQRCSLGHRAGPGPTSSPPAALDVRLCRMARSLRPALIFLVLCRCLVPRPGGASVASLSPGARRRQHAARPAA